MTTTVHQTIDTIYNADSVEWCPIEGFQDLLLCGTYQLEEKDTDKGSHTSEGPQVRVGHLYLFALQNQDRILNLTKLWERDMQGILDIKWCSTLIKGKPTFGLVNSIGQLQFYSIDQDNRGVNHVTETQLCDECLGLSLDWNNAVDGSLAPHVTTSDSTGNIHVYRFSPSEFKKLYGWRAHNFEAWITAFNHWQPDLVYSGGDDCLLKGWDLRIASSKPAITSKRHTMGVCSIQSSPVHEHVLATGSYDEQLLIWDSRQMKKPLTETGLGGGIWRIKWEPKRGDKILTATMYNGFRVVDTSNMKDGCLKIWKHFQDHQSIGYGADWCRIQTDNDQPNRMEACRDSVNIKHTIATCSFYDHILKLWDFQADHNKQNS